MSVVLANFISISYLSLLLSFWVSLCFILQQLPLSSASFLSHNWHITEHLLCKSCCLPDMTFFRNYGIGGKTP